MMFGLQEVRRDFWDFIKDYDYEDQEGGNPLDEEGGRHWYWSYDSDTYPDEYPLERKKSRERLKERGLIKHVPRS